MNSSLNGEDNAPSNEVQPATSSASIAEKAGGDTIGKEAPATSGSGDGKGGGKFPPPFNRSRTDSTIIYTPPSIGEAPGSTFYIKKSGQMDYLVLLKVILNVRRNLILLSGIYCFLNWNVPRILFHSLWECIPTTDSESFDLVISWKAFPKFEAGGRLSQMEDQTCDVRKRDLNMQMQAATNNERSEKRHYIGTIGAILSESFTRDQLYYSLSTRVYGMAPRAQDCCRFNLMLCFYSRHCTKSRSVRTFAHNGSASCFST